MAFHFRRGPKCRGNCRRNWRRRTGWGEIIGPHGSGKSTLLAALRALVGSSGPTSLRGGRLRATWANCRAGGCGVAAGATGAGLVGHVAHSVRAAHVDRNGTGPRAGRAARGPLAATAYRRRLPPAMWLPAMRAMAATCARFCSICTTGTSGSAGRCERPPRPLRNDCVGSATANFSSIRPHDPGAVKQ